MTERFRLRPRRAWAVWLMVVFGALLLALPVLYGVRGTARTVDLIAGGGTLVMAAIYLASPTWRSAVVLSEEGIVIDGPRGQTYCLAWAEVTEVLIDEEERAALVRGPAGKPSFLLPSGAHPAPYDIQGAPELYARIVAAVPAALLRQTKEFR